MTKKDFIALADAIRTQCERQFTNCHTPFNEDQIRMLADFCQSRNSQFKRSRWLDYIAGECGPNGGPIK